MKEDGILDKEHKDRFDKAINLLSEHYDTVHIFATRHNEDGDKQTDCFSRGIGNWPARYGQIKEWITFEEEVTRQKARDFVKSEE